MEQEELLKKVGWILAKLKIPYIITGGIAIAVWGRPRFTADIDIVVELTPQKISQLAGMLLDIDKDAYLDKSSIKEALEKKGEFSFVHPTSGLKVDFWILKNDDFDRERIKRRVRKKIGGQTLYFSSPEDLILIKLQWYKISRSTRQLEDIQSILKIQKRLDTKYLKKWMAIQSTAGILEKLLLERNF